MLQKSVLLRFSDAGNAERRGCPGKCNVTPFLKGEFLFMPRFSGKEARSGVSEEIPGKREREKLSLFVSGCQSGSSGPVCPSRRRFSLTISFSFLFLCSLILLTYLWKLPILASQGRIGIIMYLFSALMYLFSALMYLFSALMYLFSALMYLFSALMYLFSALMYLFSALMYHCFFCLGTFL